MPAHGGSVWTLTLAQLSSPLTACGDGFNPERDLKIITHSRFRSDADRDGRKYRVIEGRERNRVGEFIFYGRKKTTDRTRLHAPTALASVEPVVMHAARLLGSEWAIPGDGQRGA
jgi:hypothetical protein